MPRELLDAFRRNIPRLRAEWAMLASNVAAFPHMPEDKRRSMFRDWAKLTGTDDTPVFQSANEFQAFIMSAWSG